METGRLISDGSKFEKWDESRAGKALWMQGDRCSNGVC